ncbi:MAG: acyl-CoA thioesterase [Planctomycetes bacterium]|nr:acyl-CoA thioesterase [Planctomycetota bacterium]
MSAMETPRIPDSRSIRFKVTLHTRWSDEDNQGVLNNAVYLTLFEEARHRYFCDLGLLEGAMFPFVLAQTNVVFLSPGKGGVDVVVEARTTVLGSSSFTQVYRVTDPATGTIWCEAEARLVAWDNEGRKKGSISAHFRERVAAFEALGSV